MAMQITTAFAFSSWDEQPFSEVEGAGKLTHARIANRYSGAIEGEGTLEYLMLYRDGDAAADYIGLERIVGRVGERAGSFVLQHTGTYENGAATTRWTVVPGAGAGELRGLRGEGGFVAKMHEQPVQATLDCRFE